jgi:hypothetical protein
MGSLNLEVTCCESPNNQNRDLQAHAILFVIRYSDSSWESEIAAIKKVIKGRDYGLGLRR